MNRNKSKSSIEPVSGSEERIDKEINAAFNCQDISSFSLLIIDDSTSLRNSGIMMTVGSEHFPSSEVSYSADALPTDISVQHRSESADCFPLDFDVVVDSHSEPGTGGPSLPPKKRNFSDVGLAGRAPCEDKVHLWLASAAPLQGRRNSEPQTSDQRPASRDVSPDPGSDAIRNKSEGPDSVSSSYHSDGSGNRDSGCNQGQITTGSDLTSSMSIGSPVTSDLQVERAKEILGHDPMTYSASSSPKESSKSPSNGLSSDNSSRSLAGADVDKISFSSVGKSSKNSSSDKKKRSSNWYNRRRKPYYCKSPSGSYKYRAVYWTVGSESDSVDDQVLSPTYKSRCEDFKRIFKGISQDERLIVDYSCALHKDIFIQGRLYVTQNWICFYANIFRWETVLTIRCKDIIAMTKEKTARVIPNAIQICTKDEKYNFASLSHRDKTYLMLFRVWQNALYNQQMTPQELWQWVHHSYGDELGLNSSDDDYLSPTLEDEANFQATLMQEEEKLISLTTNGDALCNTPVPVQQITKYSKEDDRVDFIEAPVEEPLEDDDPGVALNGDVHHLNVPLLPDNASVTTTSLDDGPSFAVPQLPTRGDGGTLKVPSEMSNGVDMPTDLGDTTEDDDDGAVECAGHDHYELVGVDSVYAVPVDKMFDWLFTDSSLYRDFTAARKTFDVVHGTWPDELDGNGEKSRSLNYVLSLNYSIGPKTSPLAETQVCRTFKPGHFYLVDTECVNSGIPYGDNFYVVNRYCLSRVSSNKCRLLITSQIKYRKSVWGIAKNFIEKNATSGINESFSVLGEMLHQECHKLNQMQSVGPSTATPGRKKVLRRRKNSDRAPAGKRPGAEANLSKPMSLPSNHIPHRGVTVHSDETWHIKLTADTLVRLICTVLIVLVLFNGILFYKLWWLEQRAAVMRPFNAFPNGRPASQDEWLDLLSQQQVLHQQEMQKWQEVLTASISLMEHMKSSLVDLQRSIDLRSEFLSRSKAPPADSPKT